MTNKSLVVCAFWVAAQVLAAQTGRPSEVTVGTERFVRAPANVPHPPVSDAERQAMRQLSDAMRAAADALVNNNPPSPPGRPLVRDPQTVLANPRLTVAPATPDAFVLGGSVINPNLPLAGQTSIVEPSVSNMSLQAFYLSNDRVDFTSDGGQTFTQVPIPGGPPDAPNFCCDQTIVYDPSHSMWLWSRLYTKGVNGVVQISVIKNAPTIACTFTRDPGGSANNIKPDYPQLGLSDNKLYLSTSEFQNGVWFRDRMLRFDLDEMAACPASVSSRFVAWNGPAKRVWTPVRGAKEIMYWGQFENTTQLRIWTWPESDNAPTNVVKTVQQTTFANSDCRGGTNNLDWIESKGWGIGEGFMRGALARGGVGSENPACQRLHFYWNAANDATHPQAYIRSAVFELPSLTLVAEPNINSDEFCYGYADVHPNARGDLGVTLAFGGRNGGNGRALGAGVAIEDEFTAGFNLNTVFVTTDGTDMPAGQRYGDYLSVKPHEPCPLWWTAGNYAFVGGGNTANLVGRYLEFGRERDQNCWERWNEVTPKVLP